MQKMSPNAVETNAVWRESGAAAAGNGSRICAQMIRRGFDVTPSCWEHAPILHQQRSRRRTVTVI